MNLPWQKIPHFITHNFNESKHQKTNTDPAIFWEFHNILQKYSDYKQVYTDESKDSNRVWCSAKRQKKKKKWLPQFSVLKQQPYS